MMEECGYPDMGIYLGDCPPAGHDMICLDYRNCGKGAEPRAVYVYQEDDYEVTFLAENFEQFIQGLVNDEVFDEE